MKNKKSQSAMEFIMTYGWAILFVAVAVVAVAYFGLLNSDKFLPEREEGIYPPARQLFVGDIVFYDCTVSKAVVMGEYRGPEGLLEPFRWAYDVSIYNEKENLFRWRHYATFVILDGGDCHMLYDKDYLLINNINSTALQSHLEFRQRTSSVNEGGVVK